jgi:hypothetical protein
MNKWFIGLISIILSVNTFAQNIYDTGSNAEPPSSTSSQSAKQKPAEYKSKVADASQKVITALSQELQQQLASVPNVGLSSSTSNQVQPVTPQPAIRPSATTSTSPLAPPAPPPAQTPSYTGFGSGSKGSTPNKSTSSKFSVY